MVVVVRERNGSLACGIAVLVCLALVLSALGSATDATAGASLALRAESTLSLPSDATRAAGAQNAGLESVACPSVGGCVAVGGYRDSGNSAQAMVAIQVRGVWMRAHKLLLPSGAALGIGQQDADLSSVACPSAGNCVAVGNYADTGGGYQAMVATDVSGVWGPAEQLALPATAIADASAQAADLLSVTCTGPGECVAVGDYADSTDQSRFNSHAMVVSETAGRWGQASGLSLPSNAATSPGEQAFLTAVTCSSPGSCVAGGEYYIAANDAQAMVVSETGGVWQRASELLLPSGAASTPRKQHAGLRSLACTSAGECFAVGSFEDSHGRGQAMVASESAGAWRRASELSLPHGAPGGGQDALLYGVTCAGRGTCVAVGEYHDSAISYAAMVTTAAGGVWGRASKVRLPSAGGFAYLDSIACGNARSCVAVGEYKDPAGSFQAIVAS
jgi:hypothetical protein